MTTQIVTSYLALPKGILCLTLIFVLEPDKAFLRHIGIDHEYVPIIKKISEHKYL